MNIHEFADTCPVVHYVLGTRVFCGRELHCYKSNVLILAGDVPYIVHERNIFATNEDAVAEALYRSGRQRDRAIANIEALSDRP